MTLLASSKLRGACPRTLRAGSRRSTLQQAAEKLVKAVRLHRGLFATADHNILALVDELPSDDAWRAKLSALGVLSAYATTFRYPSPTGKRKPGLSGKEVLEWIERIGALVVDLRAVLAGSV